MKKSSYFIMNVVAPVSLGVIFYYLFFPETVFVGVIDRIFGLSYHIPVDMDHLFLRGLRFYLFDFLWAYAFMAIVVCFLGCKKKYIFIVVIFEIVLEVLQLMPGVYGTFDICDILIEILANILVIITSDRDDKENTGVGVIQNVGGDVRNEKD